MGNNASPPSAWTKATLISMGLLLALLSATAFPSFAPAQSGQDPLPTRTCYLFLTPSSVDEANSLVSTLAPKNSRIRFFGASPSTPHLAIKPVLLIDDYSKLQRTFADPTFIKLLRSLSPQGLTNLPLWDSEGVALARELKLRSVPALAIMSKDHWHVATGSKADLNALVSCRRCR